MKFHSSRKAKMSSKFKKRFTLTPEGTIRDSFTGGNYHKTEVVNVLNCLHEVAGCLDRVIEAYLYGRDQQRVREEIISIIKSNSLENGIYVQNSKG